MQPAARPSFQPAAAGGVLLGVLVAAIAVGAFVGWALGSVGYGVLVGAIAGIPLAVYAVYRRYRSSL
jgi:F0F1-type ATP synthase assembly protein I